jgi:hypothetical protein
MQKAGILQGNGGYFDPQGNTTRAQAAKIISMIMDLKLK